MLSVQGDKRALQEINHRADDVKLAYNRTMNTTVLEKVDSKVVQSLAAELEFDHESMTNIGNMVRRSDGSWDETITVWRDRRGNELHLASPTNPSTTPKVGADRDFTARYKVAGGDDVVDVPHDHLRSIHYEAALSETIGADARAIGLPDDPKLLAQRMDHEITSGLHREAYTDLETILYSPAGQIQDPEQIRLAMRYKGEHWMRERVDEASELMGRNITEAELVEDYVAEGMRQVTKQFDNQVRARFDATNAARAADGLPPLRMPERLERSYEVLARVNPKPPARPTLSPVEAEMLLHDLGTSPTRFVDEIGAFMEMMEKGKTLT